MKILQKILIVFCGLCAIAAFSYFAFIFNKLFNNPFNDLYFNQVVWQEAKNFSGMDNPRGRMFEDLQNRLLKNRPDRDKILEMLGAPDYPKQVTGHEKQFSYFIGNWSGFRMDMDTLELEFGDSGHVVKVYRVQH